MVKVQGITIEIGGDTTKLGEALKDVDNQLRNSKSQLKDVDRLLKLDPGNTELLNQKYKALNDSIDTTKKRLQTLKTASEEAAKTAGNYDAWKEKYDSIQKEIGETDTKLKELKTQAEECEKALKNGEIDQEAYDKLQSEITETKDKLKELKDQAKATSDEFGNPISPEEWDALQREIIETEESMKKLNKEMGNFGSVSAQSIATAGEKVSAVGTKIEDAGKAIMPASAAVLGIGAAAVKTTAEFDTSMSKVAAVSGALGDDLDALRDKAREMGAKTKFSASEAAEAMNYMAMAGWKTEDMLGGIDGIMNLAAASGENLATTSDIVTDALTAFGMTAQKSAHLADILAAASSNSNTNVSMLGESFKYAAPMAGALGYSAEDTAAALGLMANAGIKASQGGTALRNLFTNMSKQTDESSAAMERLGVSLYDDEGRMYSFREIMDQMRESFDHINMPIEEFNAKINELDQNLEDGTLTESKYDKAVEELTRQAYGAEGAEKARVAAMLAGKTGLSGLLAIVNATEEDYEKLTSAIEGCSDTFEYAGKTYNGAAEYMSAIMIDNLEGQLDILKAQLQELAISVGDVLMPVVRELVSWLQGVADWLNNLSPAQKEMAVRIGAVVAAAGPLLIVVGKVAKSVGDIMKMAPKIVNGIKTIKTIVPTLVTSLKGLWAVIAANPIILIAAGIAAAVAAFIHFWNTSEEFRQFWYDLGEKLIAIWDKVQEALASIWNAITAAAQTIFNGIVSFFTNIWGTITEGVLAAWNTIGSFLSETWGSIRDKAGEIWGNVKSKISDATEAAGTALQEKWDGIRTSLGETWGNIHDKAGEIWGNIKSTMSKVTDAIKETIQEKWDNIKKAYEEHGGGLKGIAAATVEAIKGYWTAGFDVLNNLLGGKLDGIKQLFSDAWEAVKNTVYNAIEKIKSFFDFEWELPPIKLPHFKINGKFSLSPPSVPSIGVEWYRKAMNNGMILTSPTIFGAANGKLLGGGEAGPEAVIGTSSLSKLITDAVAKGNAGQAISIPRNATQTLYATMYLKETEIGRVLVPIINEENQRIGVKLAKGGGLI